MQLSINGWLHSVNNVGSLILHKDSGSKNLTEAYLGCVFCLGVSERLSELC